MKVKNIECFGEVFKEVELVVSIPDKDFAAWATEINTGEKTKDEIALSLGLELIDAMQEYVNNEGK